MAFIETTSVEAASGEVADLYRRQQGAWGFVPNYARVFCHRPAVIAVWGELLGTIKSGMDRRRFELVTLAAAREMKSSYCALAHGRILCDDYLSTQELERVLDNVEDSVLSEVDKVVMRLAAQVVRDASSVTEEDVTALVSLGISAGEVFDIIAAASARCFFAKLVDALGVAPDSSFQQMDEGLRQRLIVGREIDPAAAECIEPAPVSV